MRRLQKAAPAIVLTVVTSVAQAEDSSVHGDLAREEAGLHVTSCTSDMLIADLRDNDLYAMCETDDINCFRAVGDGVARACLGLDLFACGGGRAGSEDLARASECMLDRRRFADAASAALRAELPPLQDIGKIDQIGFTEERIIIQQLEDLDAHAWPAECGAFPTETLRTTDVGCANMFAQNRLLLLSGIAAVLHGAAGAF